MRIRSRAERQADVRARLRTDSTAWLATAGDDGPHLVPMSLCWHREAILLATAEDRPVARDLARTGRARLGLGDGTDVVVIDATVTAGPWAAADPVSAEAFVGRVGWDPGQQAGTWLLLHLAPRRIRAWRSVEENLEGSLLMRDGTWLPSAPAR